MGTLRNLSLLSGLVMLAVVLVALGGRGARVAHADIPEPVPESMLFHKHCFPLGVGGTFELFMDVQFEPDNLDGDAAFDEDMAFDRTLTISCGDNESTGPDDGDTLLLSVGAADTLLDLTALDQFLDDVIGNGDLEQLSVTVMEINVPAGVDLEVVPPEACSFFVGIANDNAVGVAFFDEFLADGLVCTFENTITTDALPDLSITKLCLGDPGAATFGVSIGLEGEAPLDTRPIECGGTEDFSDLAPGAGAYTLAETIEGAEGDVATIIGCDGVPVSTETSISLPLALGDSVSCTVINVFGLDPDEVDDLVCSCTCCGGLEIDIDLNNANTNTIGIENANANNNANANDNANFNDNENENKNDNKNENTQDQTNSQDQDNANSQTNNITSSPEVNIDFD